MVKTPSQIQSTRNHVQTLVVMAARGDWERKFVIEALHALIEESRSWQDKNLYRLALRNLEGS